MTKEEQRKEIINILTTNVTEVDNFNIAVFEDDFEAVATDIVNKLESQQQDKKIGEVSDKRKLFNGFYEWLDGLTQAEYDDMSLTEKIEKYFFTN